MRNSHGVPTSPTTAPDSQSQSHTPLGVGRVGLGPARDLEQAIDERVAERIAVAERRRRARRDERAELARRRNAGLTLRHQRREPMSNRRDLRRAITDLTPGQRLEVIEIAGHLVLEYSPGGNAADRPEIAEVWRQVGLLATAIHDRRAERQ